MSYELDKRVLARAIRERILADLNQHERADGTVPVKEVRKAAKRAGVEDRTIYNWRVDGVPENARESFAWEEDYDDILAECRGNVAEFRRRLDERGVQPLVTRQRLNEIVAKRFGNRARALLKGGEAGARPFKLRRIIEIPQPNLEWQADFFNLGLPVEHPDFPSQLVDLWACVLTDSCTRVVVGAAVGIDRDAGLVLSALAAALRTDGVYGPWGGKPATILVDNDTPFLAESIVYDFVGVLDLRVEQCYVGSSEGKGKIERFGGTLKSRWARLQPDSTEGPKWISGDLYPSAKNPNFRDRAAGLFAAIDDYNTVWPHSSIGDIPPAEKWEAEKGNIWRPDGGSVSEYTPAELLALMQRQPALVAQKGIACFKDHYWAPELYRHVGDAVEIRYVWGDTRQVEVMLDGEWLCSAVPNRDRSEENDDRCSQLERADMRKLNGLVRKANGVPTGRRTRVAMTQAGEASPVRDPSPASRFRIGSNADIVSLVRARVRLGDDGGSGR